MKKRVKKQITVKSFTCSLISLISCISLCFVCLFPVKKVYAEGEAGTLQTGKNILTLLLGQMGVELVGAVTTVDTYVQEAWSLFLNGLSSPITPEAYTLTAIAGMVQWDDVNNVLSVPKDLYNLVSQWALDLSNAYDVAPDTVYKDIASVYIPASGITLPKITANTTNKSEVISKGLSVPGNNSTRTLHYLGLNDYDVKIAFYVDGSRYGGCVLGITSELYNSLGTEKVAAYVTSDQISNTPSLFQKTSFNSYLDVYYHYISYGQFLLERFSDTSFILYDSLTEAVASFSEGAAELQDNIYVNGNALLDDRIVSTDNGAQLELDPVLEQGITYSLDDVLTAVMDWVTTNTWPDMTTVFVDALPITLDEPIDTVLIPTAPYVEVPQVLLPSNLPIIYNPECESLSACLVAGISAVSNDITSFYNSNESIRNYANIILFVGVSFVALGVIRRHL